MAKPLAVFAADTHLADRAWAYRPVEGDSYHSFSQIVSFCLKHHVPLMLAGDIIDRQVNSSGPITVLSVQLAKLEDAGLPVWFIQGQHEQADVPWLSISRTCKHVHRCTFEVGAFRCYGLDYSPAGQLQDELNQIPLGTDILCAHQVWGEFMGSVASPQGGIGDVPVVGAVFTGDYHVNKTIETRGKDGQTVVVTSPGSTCMQDISEDAQKFFTVLTDTGTFQKVRLKTRGFLDWGVLNRPEELDRFVSLVQSKLGVFQVVSETEMPENLRKPLLRVTYSYRLTDATKRIKAAVGDMAHIFFKELAPQADENALPVLERDPESRSNAATMTMLLPEFLTRKELTGLQSDCQRLLQTNDVEGELRRMREEALK